MQDAWIFLVVVGAGAVIISVVLSVVYMQRRKQKQRATKYQQALGEDNLESQPSSLRLVVASPPTSQSSRTGRSRNIPSSTGRGASSAAGAAAGAANARNSAAVDRHASIRSVMTLPAYRQTASNNEQVLGREGERDGIDTIIDLPTEEEHEALREDEMEAMYQIRLARRQQIEGQQQRRAERRDARQRGDSAALAGLRARARAASNSSPIEHLRREMERAKQLRNRAVPIVSYADLGVARHDGTRIRANSNDSERMALLTEAAAAAATATNTDTNTTDGSSQLPRPSLHTREPSAASVMSVDSDDPAARVRSAPHSRGGSQSAGGGAMAGSSPELVEADVGDEQIPPPDYEDISLADAEADGGSIQSRHSITEPPPDYTGPYRSGSQRTELGRARAASTGRGPAGDTIGSPCCPKS
ncbi:hypothetical protein ESCO_006657 [Escovopsis weberi]|uniref:Uncharacterized protein n=1 Tax=Escovopsis weberi TaxID=150374 RepID=A0A0M8NAG0_ESCWE|nr:hypothetical protein ESCO_006657 [Escovopsis weberi]